MLLRLGIVASMLVTLASIFTGSSSAQTAMTHHLHAPLQSAALQPIGKLPSTQNMTLDVVLPLRDSAGLDDFIAQVSDPSSPSYRQFLTPTQFASRFGPKQADYDALVTFFKNNGFKVYGGTFLGREVQVKAPVSVVEATFHLAMNVYQHPTESRTFYSPDREPTTNLPFPLWHIGGLDNFSIPKPSSVKRNNGAKSYKATPQSATPNMSGGSGPSASYLGSDMRAAYYSSGGGSLTGAGQNLGLFEYGGTDLDDLTAYYTSANQTLTVPVNVVSTDGTDPTCFSYNGCDDSEQNIDLTQALGMAPGLNSLTMYVGELDTAIIGALVASDPLPTTIGCSWQWLPADPATLDPYFKQMIAQGQNFFVASGNNSTWGNSSSLSQPWPADDPYIVSVGGTSVVTTGPGGAWVSESAWPESGGGISTTNEPIPSWQVPAINSINQGSTTLRNGPDVSANSDYNFLTCSDQQPCNANFFGGTGFAASIWAGYIALVNQAIATSGGSSLGFLNPLIYAQNANASTYAANFHDILNGSSGSYAANAGYDLVTGWGSPTPALLTTLISTPAGTKDFILTAPSTLYSNVTSGTVENPAIRVTSRYGFTGSVTLSCAAAPPLTCSLASGTTTLTANGNTVTPLTINTAGIYNTGGIYAFGNYVVTLTATGSSGTHTLPITINVTKPPVTPYFSLSTASPTAVTTTLSFTDSVSLASVNAFAGVVNLQCSATGGLTCSLANNSATLASGGTVSTIVTINDSAVTGGSYSVTVAGTDASTGKIINSTSIAVTVPNTDFVLADATPGYSLSTGATVTDTLNVGSVGNFVGTVALGCSATGGLVCSLGVPSTKLTGYASSSATLTVFTQNVTVPGIYIVTVTGTNSSVVHSLLIPVNISSITSSPFVVTNAGDISLPTQGASGQTNLVITPNATFASTVSLTCSIVAMPTGAVSIPTCSVPASVVIAQGTTNYTAFLTVSSTPQTPQASLDSKPVAWLAGGLFLSLLFLPVSRRRLPVLTSVLALAVLFGIVTGCSSKPSSSSSSPPATVGSTLGSYLVSVTGTSGSASSTTILHVNVN